MPTRRALAEGLGTAGGALLAPLTAAGSRLRGSRLFHPDGVCLAAEVVPVADRALGEAARRLAGPALVRLSSAWWKHGRPWPDVMGAAIRFTRRDPAEALVPTDDDQDLLLATVPRPYLLPISPIFGRPHDYFANTFDGTSPFEVDGVGRLRLRMVAARRPAASGDRRERLATAVARGEAVFVLEARPVRLGAGWTPMASVSLLELLDLDQEALRFDPFQEGRGLHPRSLVHALRRLAYPASRANRPETAVARAR